MAEVTKLVDVTRCVGCRACMVACKEWYDLPGEWEGARFEGSHQQAGGTLGYNRWVNVQFYELGGKQDGPPSWFFRKHQCLHCGQPPCVEVCPVGALERTESGAVNLDQDLCIGCRYCETNCPFGVPRYGAAERKVSKCILCYDRIQNGQEPICVKTCSARALIFGEREKVLAEAQARLELARTRFPEARIYNPEGVGGTHVVYILPGPPEAFGLPAEPQVPVSVGLWQSITKPLGGIAVGASLAASVVAAIIQRRTGTGGGDTAREGA